MAKAHISSPTAEGNTNYFDFIGIIRFSALLEIISFILDTNKRNNILPRFAHVMCGYIYLCGSEPVDEGIDETLLHCLFRRCSSFCSSFVMHHSAKQQPHRVLLDFAVNSCYYDTTSLQTAVTVASVDCTYYVFFYFSKFIIIFVVVINFFHCSGSLIHMDKTNEEEKYTGPE